MQKSDEETVVQRATDLFRRQGYHRTSMADVGEASGLLKGSLYHYFPGKEQLGARAIERVLADFRARLFALARQQEWPPAVRLERMSEATRMYFASREGGCLMGNLALETVGTVPAFRGAIADYFREWIDAYAQVYRDSGLGAAAAMRAAEEAVALIQGALMMTRIFGKPEFLERVLATLAAGRVGGV